MNNQFRLPKKEYPEESDDQSSRNSKVKMEVESEERIPESSETRIEAESESQGRSSRIPKVKMEVESEGSRIEAMEVESESEQGSSRTSKVKTEVESEEPSRIQTMESESQERSKSSKSRTELESQQRSSKMEIESESEESSRIPTPEIQPESRQRSSMISKTEIPPESEFIRNRHESSPRISRNQQPSSRHTVEVHEVKKESDDCSYSIFYKGHLIEDDSKNLNLPKISEIPKICIKGIRKKRNMVVSTNNSETKNEISRFALETCAAEGRCTYFVVRNDVVARRRYFDLSEAFPYVSLLSLKKGKIDNKNGFIFVVTIDVIRILLYHGANFGNNILIFDDCEYLGETETGSMYEESLAMLGYAQLILFFPQISNANQIARWICSNFNNDVESVSVKIPGNPVRHFICYYQQGQAVSMSLVFNEKGELNESALEAPLDRPSMGTVNTKINELSIYQIQDTIVRLIRTANGLSEIPILVYCNNMDDVERLANNMGNFNFNSGSNKFGALEEDDSKNESKKILEHVQTFVLSLEEQDKKNPMIENVKQFAFRGIGIYHDGMIPFLRSLTEELFIHGLIKVLFADKAVIWETNLKFKCVLINEPKIIIEPGYSRWMTGREFHKISERATGKNNPFVVTVLRNKLPPNIVKEYYTRNYPPINSKFKFSPNCVLNLSRHSTSSHVHEAKIDKKFLMEKLFMKFQRLDESDRISDELRNKKSLLQSFNIKSRIEKNLSDYNSLLKEIENKTEDVYSEAMKSEKIKDFLQIGRILKINYNGQDFGYGVVLQKGTKKISVAVRVTKESFEAEDPKYLRPAIEDENETLAVIAVVPERNVTRISSYRLRLPIDKKLEDPGMKEFIIWSLKEEEKGLGFPDLHPIEDLKIDDSNLSNMWRRLTKLKDKAQEIEKEMDNFDQNWKIFQEKQNLENDIQKLEEIKKEKNLENLNEEFENIKEFLKPVKFFNDGNLTMKGIFAAYLRMPNAVIVSDILFTTELFEKNPKNVILGLSYVVEHGIKDEFIKEPTIKIFKYCKTIISKYADCWKKITKDCSNFEEKFHFTLMIFVQFLLSEKFRGFHEIYKQLRYCIREGVIATYLKKLDEMLLEVCNLKSFLPSDYDGEFWDEFEKLRITKIHRGLIMATNSEMRICKIDYFK